MFQHAALVAFVAVSDLERAHAFYGGTLGLERVDVTPFAYVYSSHGSELRVTLSESSTPQDHTVVGWDVGDIDAAVDELTSAGVEMRRYAGMELDARGIWTAPGGARIAWFTDPDGNVLSLQQQPAS